MNGQEHHLIPGVDYFIFLVSFILSLKRKSLSGFHVSWIGHMFTGSRQHGSGGGRVHYQTQVRQEAQNELKN